MALREKLPNYTAFGVAGSAMIETQVEAVATTDDLSVMGVTEVLARVSALRMLESRLLSWVDKLQPSFAVLIDNPGFNLRLAEQLKLRGITVFQYVAPKVWAWGGGRIARLKRDIDMILGILPFEEEYFRNRGVNYAYVGSPLKDRINKIIIRRETLGLSPTRPIIACLPGSRPSEIALNLPTLVGVRDIVAKELPDALFVVPIAPNIAIDLVDETLRARFGMGLTPYQPEKVGDLQVESWMCGGLRFVRGMSLEMMAIADAAVVASGTATLECALLGTPMVVVYTMSSLSYEIAKRVVKLPYVSLVNLIFGQKVVQEFIQDFSLADVGAEVLSLLRDQGRRQDLTFLFADMRDKLPGFAASTAANIIAGTVSSPGRASARSL